ncbi:Multiple RNA-binding domain-containing protein 1, partial [Taenia solium]
YNDNILYVQWAPEGILPPPESRSADEEAGLWKEESQRKPDESTREDAKAKFVDLIDTDKVEEPDDIDVNIGEKEEDCRESEKRKGGREEDADGVKEEGEDGNKALKRRKHKRAETKDAAEPVHEDKVNSRKKRKMMQNDAEAVDAKGDAEVDGSSPSKKARQTEDEEEFSLVRKPADVVVSTTLPIESPQSRSQKKAVTKRKEEEESRVILVRNVAFQASQSEVTALFKPLGGLVKVRMPQKPSGGHRGFAFVEFATHDQAKSALETFGVDTHLMGRRLNIEYARLEVARPLEARPWKNGIG